MKTITLDPKQFEALPAFVERRPASSEVSGLWKFRDGRHSGWIIGQYNKGVLELYAYKIVETLPVIFESSEDVMSVKKPFVLSSETESVSVDLPSESISIPEGIPSISNTPDYNFETSNQQPVIVEQPKPKKSSKKKKIVEGE